MSIYNPEDDDLQEKLEPSNLDRAMRAETCLNDYEAFDQEDAQTSIKDLISDLCHLLHLDEKTAGCMEPEAIKQLLESAFNNFEAEMMEENHA